jgi:peptidyl-prolyl cis-trans isomerase C/peptidyl-prolyl cis-trans isomerase SurA
MLRRTPVFAFLLLAASSLGCPSLTEPGDPVVFADPPPPPVASTPAPVVASAPPAPSPAPTPSATVVPQEMITASHILVSWKGAALPGATRTKDEARKRIQEVIDKLKKGGDFAKLAAEYSEDRSNKDKGGDLGAFGKGRMVPPFEAAAFALKVGDVSGIVETQFGFHVIKRTK